MSKIDQLTGRGANFGHSRSHSNIASKRRQDVNLQTIKIDGKRIRISARTLKSIKRLAKVMSGEIPTLKQKKQAKRVERAAKKGVK
ncbi:50S ribosomal protein L28 [Candidatus Uhrbacteria bacterium]|nr:50S ribosomal protein L28 [Candidatus Uhrbacteria bacterium]